MRLVLAGLHARHRSKSVQEEEAALCPGFGVHPAQPSAPMGMQAAAPMSPVHWCSRVQPSLVALQQPPREEEPQRAHPASGERSRHSASEIYMRCILSATRVSRPYGMLRPGFAQAPGVPENSASGHGPWLHVPQRSGLPRSGRRRF